MQRRILLVAGLAGVGALAAALVWRRWRRGPALPPPVPPLDRSTFAGLYAAPLTPPAGPLRVFHLGHSLVGRDMPAMLAQLAGHRYESQLGWGAPLRSHWEERVPVNGFETENAHPRFRPAKEAMASGEYDAVVLTEAVELRDSIRWCASAHYLAQWARAARAGNPDARVYLYESWHSLDDPEGWLERLDADLERYWEGELLRGAAALDGGAPIHLIPAGQVLARVARAAESGELPGVTSREALFTRATDGTRDKIHPGDLGNYVVALTHFAVLYHRTPEGLPHELTRADGTPIEPIAPATAAVLQRLVWQIVRATPLTGLAAR